MCIAKKKTKVARKSLDPLYNQVLLFAESPQGKVLQVRRASLRSAHLSLPPLLEASRSGEESG